MSYRHELVVSWVLRFPSGVFRPLLEGGDRRLVVQWMKEVQRHHPLDLWGIGALQRQVISQTFLDVSVFIQIPLSARYQLRQILSLCIGSIQNAASLRVRKRRRRCSSLIHIVTRGIVSRCIALWLSLLRRVLHSGLNSTTRGIIARSVPAGFSHVFGSTNGLSFSMR